MNNDKSNVVAAANIDGDNVYVIDKQLGGRDARILQVDDYGYHSRIFKDPDAVYQPFFMGMQKYVSVWANITGINQVKGLVLGGGGLAMPRFLLKKWGNSMVTCIEYSHGIMELAKKYFCNGLDMKRMKLVEGDAYEWVKQKHLYNFIFVDLFQGSMMSEHVQDGDFLENLSTILTDNGLCVINLDQLSVDEFENFKENAMQYFSKVTRLMFMGKYPIACMFKKIDDDTYKKVNSHAKAAMQKNDDEYCELDNSADLDESLRCRQLIQLNKVQTGTARKFYEKMERRGDRYSLGRGCGNDAYDVIANRWNIAQGECYEIILENIPIGMAVLITGKNNIIDYIFDGYRINETMYKDKYDFASCFHDSMSGDGELANAFIDVFMSRDEVAQVNDGKLSLHDFVQLLINRLEKTVMVDDLCLDLNAIKSIRTNYGMMEIFKSLMELLDEKYSGKYDYLLCYPKDKQVQQLYMRFGCEPRYNICEEDTSWLLRPLNKNSDLPDNLNDAAQY